MSEAQIHIDDAGDEVAVVRLDRPPVNALNPRWLSDIGAAFEKLDGDGSVRAVVLSGAGKTLSAGMDLKELQAFTAEDQRDMVNALNGVYGTIYGLGKPLVCAAHGAAIAGGLFFVLVSDYRVAGERAVFGLAEVRVGVRFPVGPLAIAMNELSPSACRRLILGAGNHAASGALALGVVDEVVATDRVLERAVTVAREYAALPAATFAETKRALRAGVLARLAQLELQQPDPMLEGWFTDETEQATRALLASLR